MKPPYLVMRLFCLYCRAENAIETTTAGIQAGFDMKSPLETHAQALGELTLGASRKVLCCEHVRDILEGAFPREKKEVA